MPESPPPLLICWTTVAKREDAERIARESVASGLAACAQIDGPITSVYQWKGQIETETEHRIWLKVTAANLEQLESFVAERHPYDTPQWIVVAAEKVSEKYLKWAQEVSNLRGFY